MQLCRNVVNQYLNLVHGGNRVRHNLKPFRGAERIREEMPSASHPHTEYDHHYLFHFHQGNRFHCLADLAGQNSKQLGARPHVDEL